MRIFKLILNKFCILVCIWVPFYVSIEGSDIDCTLDCACCKDKVCGQGQWFSDECILGCIDGYRSARCYLKCKYDCKQCERSEDYCISCYDGFYPGPARDCTSKCLPNCKTCTSGSTCTTCKEEYYNDNGYNDCRYRKCPENCKCENDQCASCKHGYYDTSTSCKSSCPDNCVTCSSSHYCNSCKDGHYNGYQYDDSRRPVLNECTYKCRDNCIQCSTYNLCSVCQPGLYGSICEKSCSVGCVSGICDIQTGSCACSSNFVGDKCDQCQNGKYGDICDKQCSTACRSNVCDIKSGYCFDGCIIDTIVGDKCDACTTGWYGTYCNISCSVGCKNNKCKRTNGECTEMCLNNFHGQQCDQCINGKYGDLCNTNCPNNCDREGCLKESGNCKKCIQNFDGGKCDRCVIGFYGSTCSEICSSYCFNKACDRDTGTCSGCVYNYSGDRCCINNNNCIFCLSDTTCKQCKSGYFKDQCDEPCPQNCLDSCSIKTGICDDCKRNFYGESCNSHCSSTCRTGKETSGSQCQQRDGRCLYGCEDGFYGMNCYQNCSDLCIDTICKQDNGTCINGCQKKVKDDLLCPFVAASKSTEQPHNSATIILGTILAVSVVGNVILVVIVIVLKFRKRVNKGERTERPLYENADMELKFGDVANVSDKTNATQESINENMTRAQDYEDLDRVQVTEHAYGRIGTPAGD